MVARPHSNANLSHPHSNANRHARSRRLVDLEGALEVIALLVRSADVSIVPTFPPSLHNQPSLRLVWAAAMRLRNFANTFASQSIAGEEGVVDGKECADQLSTALLCFSLKASGL